VRSTRPNPSIDPKHKRSACPLWVRSRHSAATSRKLYNRAVTTDGREFWDCADRMLCRWCLCGESHLSHQESAGVVGAMNYSPPSVMTLFIVQVDAGQMFTGCALPTPQKSIAGQFSLQLSIQRSALTDRAHSGRCLKLPRKNITCAPRRREKNRPKTPRCSFLKP
jgi:hypothetical protein